MTEARICLLLDSYATQYHDTHFVGDPSLRMCDGVATPKYMQDIAHLATVRRALAEEIIAAILYADSTYQQQMVSAIVDACVKEAHNHVPE